MNLKWQLAACGQVVICERYFNGLQSDHDRCYTPLRVHRNAHDDRIRRQSSRSGMQKPFGGNAQGSKMCNLSTQVVGITLHAMFKCNRFYMDVTDGAENWIRLTGSINLLSINKRFLVELRDAMKLHWFRETRQFYTYYY